jgi:hypothetical protein
MLQKEIPCVLTFLCGICPDESASSIIEKLFELENALCDKIQVTDEIKKFNISGIQIELPVRKWVRYD